MPGKMRPKTAIVFKIEHNLAKNLTEGECKMENRKSTKKALAFSVLAMVVCVAMLVGTTFAWFTDTASTGVNRIQAGNLDVELEYSTDMVNWSEATSSTKLFSDSTLWEPGVTEVVYLRVKNAGSLALKYSMGLSSNVGFANGTNVYGNTYNIGDYLKMGTATVGEKLATREAAIAAVEANAQSIKNLKPFVNGMQVVAPGETTDTIALVIYMPTDVGNEANAGTKASYAYRLGVQVNATQASVESDSFDNTYDKKAPTVFSAESASSGSHEITENIQANGRYGAVQAESSAQFTVNADVYAIYTVGGSQGAAMAVKAGGNSRVVINGGDFRQVGVPENDPCDLIYGMDSATIEINGGTFKAAQPNRTLNCLDGSAAKITVKGGSFYKYDPSHPTLGDSEVVVADGYKVVQNGDWYTVVAA